jgi:hypothetical protein
MRQEYRRIKAELIIRPLTEREKDQGSWDRVLDRGSLRMTGKLRRPIRVRAGLISGPFLWLLPGPPVGENRQV